VAIPELIRDVVSFLKASVPSNVQITARVAEPCPCVVGDRNQIHQALTNVCTNAYQALGPGGGRIEITVDVVDLDPAFAALHAMRCAPSVRIAVKDSGPGIAPTVLDRMFEPFFTTKNPGEGSGLGLAIMHAIMTKHRGAATVHSKLGEGALLQLYFPTGPSTPARRERQEPVVPASPNHQVIPRRIVCVDDEPGVLRALVRILNHAGHTVTAYTSPSEALEHIRRTPRAFDVVLTDLTMPGMRGTELAARLLEVRSDLPVVLATGYGDATTATGTLPANVRECLEKPIDVDTLVRGISRALS
jgi:CheY-like chemotaxis protein